MALKRILDNLDSLDESLKALYVERNGKFYLDAEEDTDTGTLRRALDRVRHEKTELTEKLADIQTQMDELKTANPPGKGGKKDVDVLEASWQKKFDDEVKRLSGEMSKKDEYIKSSLIDAAAAKIADVFVVPSVGARLVRERLSVEFGDEGPKVRVLDAAGSPSALSVDDLRKEFVDNKEFAPLIVASRGSGGGAGGANGGSGGGAGKTFAEMNATERTHIFNTDRVRFEREAAALKGH